MKLMYDTNREILIQSWHKIVVVALFISLTGCTSGRLGLQQRHQPSEVPPINYREYKGITFSEYIKKTGESIEEYGGLGRSAKELRLISPYEMNSEGYDACVEKQRTGVLLIHGLTDTPYSMRDIANSLRENNDCILVRSIVLPGHATVPGDLLDVRYSDWIDATNYGIQSFIDEGINNIFIAGFSTGGTLALHFAVNATVADNSAINLQGLLLFSPAIRIKPWGGFLANWHKIVSWALPKYAWLDIQEDKDFAKYESFPFNAADQIYLLSKTIDPQIKKRLATPLFVVISQDDDTINSEVTKKFFENRANNHSRLIIYQRDAENNECTFSEDDKICVRKSVYEELNIESFSHAAIPFSPDNEHYGKAGDYKSCCHYLGKKEYDDCNSDEPDKFALGEKSLYQNLTEKPVRRLAFNPDFKYMTGLMNEFISANR